MERDYSYDDLPEQIVQHILSFVPSEEAMEASLVSKTWLSASSKLPALDFDQPRFRDKFFPPHYTSSPYEVPFVKFVDNILRRHSKHEEICIDKFKLSLHLSDDTDLTPFFEKWLEIVLAKHVKHLSISLKIDKKFPISFYIMPPTIFAASSLVVLHIFGEKYTKLKLGHDQVTKKCCTLKELRIGGVEVSKSTISNICSIFPCIEYWEIYYCFRLDGIELSGLLNLKKLITFFTALFPRMVRVSDAQSLESFSYSCLNRGLYEKPQCFDISPCQSLKYLSLASSNIADTSFNSLISQCHFLEHLELEICLALERISISSHTLKTLILSGLGELDEVKIDAPNLIELQYMSGDTLATFSLINPSEDLKCTVDIDVSDDAKTSFLVKLRRLLTQLSPSKVTLRNHGKIRVDMKELRGAHEVLLDPKPKLENLELHLYSHSSTLLHGLWWSCCPAKLTVHWDDSNHSTVKFLFKTLMERRCQRCCRSDPNRCWQHYLNNVEAEYVEDRSAPYYFETSEEEESIPHPRQLDWNGLVNRSLSLYEKFKIHFSLDWRQSF